MKSIQKLYEMRLICMTSKKDNEVWNEFQEFFKNNNPKIYPNINSPEYMQATIIMGPLCRWITVSAQLTRTNQELKHIFHMELQNAASDFADSLKEVSRVVGLSRLY